MTNRSVLFALLAVVCFGVFVYLATYGLPDISISGLRDELRRPIATLTIGEFLFMIFSVHIITAALLKK